MYLIFAECAIDLVPKTWYNDRKISAYIKNRKRIPLINASDHQHLLQGMKSDQRNDRPDILHFGLLTALGYITEIPNLKIQFSSNYGIFEIEKQTRLPRSQNRFYGILESLFQNKYIGDLIFPVTSNVLQSEQPKILFTKDGDSLSTVDLHSFDIFVFGGFSSGKFKSTYPNSKRIALSSNSLDLWTAVSLFLSHYIQLS
jgi:rRNA small subunit pseudouridine methyltransferase Nep1